MAEAGPPGAPAQSARHGLGRDVVLTLGGRLALTAVILAGDVVLARGLGPEGKGAFTLVLALSSLGAAILGLGLDRALAVFAARSLDVAKRAFANSLFWILIVGGLGALAILFLYGPAGEGHEATGLLAAVMPPLTRLQLFLVAIALPGELAYAIGLTGLLGRQRVLAYNAVRFVRRALLTVLLIGLVLVERLDLETVLVLNVATIGLTVLGIGWAAWRAGMLGIRPSPRQMVQQLAFGTKTVVGTIAERLHFRVDAFLLTAYVSVAATGVYSVAQGLAETLWYLPTSFGLVLFSRAVRVDTDSGAIASAMTRSMLAIIVAGAIPLWFLAPTMVEIVYGAPFREAGQALQVMLPGVAAYSIVAILSHYVIARGAPGLATAALISGLVVNVAANVVLIPSFGMNGAAAAASLSYATTAALMLLVYTRLSGRGMRETLLVRRSDIAARLNDLRVLAGRLEQRRA